MGLRQQVDRIRPQQKLASCAAPSTRRASSRRVVSRSRQPACLRGTNAPAGPERWGESRRKADSTGCRHLYIERRLAVAREQLIRLIRHATAGAAIRHIQHDRHNSQRLVRSSAFRPALTVRVVGRQVTSPLPVSPADLRQTVRQCPRMDGTVRGMIGLSMPRASLMVPFARSGSGKVTAGLLRSAVRCAGPTSRHGCMDSSRFFFQPCCLEGQTIRRVGRCERIEICHDGNESTCESPEKNTGHDQPVVPRRGGSVSDC